MTKFEITIKENDEGIFLNIIDFENKTKATDIIVTKGSGVLSVMWMADIIMDKCKDFIRTSPEERKAKYDAENDMF